MWAISFSGSNEVYMASYGLVFEFVVTLPKLHGSHKNLAELYIAGCYCPE